MKKIWKEFKSVIITMGILIASVMGVFGFFDRITEDFVRIGDHASAQEVTNGQIQGVSKRSIENSTDLLYIHKRGTRREKKQAEDELRMLEDFDDVAEERRELIDEIADLETELEMYTEKINALKPPP